MGKAGVFVLGPAGSGKSTFCRSLISHMHVVGRSVHLVNMDPAAESLGYEPTIDIRDLISLDDVMEELKYGPNGGLIYCFDFLMQNLDWLDEKLGDYDDDYLIFDMPGQIELYTHIPYVADLSKHLSNVKGFRLCAAYLIESQFMMDPTKFFSGVLMATSAMLFLYMPHINIMSKMDIAEKQFSKSHIKRFLEADTMLLSEQVNDKTNEKFRALNDKIVNLVEDYRLATFLPLSNQNEENIETILAFIDDLTQWADDQEPKEPKYDSIEE